MRKTLVCLIAVGMFGVVAAPAIAGTVKLTGKYGKSYIEARCLGNETGRPTSGSGPGGYGCKTNKGEVSCDKNGNCTGTCQNCGGKAAAAKGGMGGILTNAPGGKVQPLTPQKTTRPTTTAPTRPLKQQKVTRSPVSTPQKMTGSPSGRPMRPLAASPSLRRNGR
jgi:hypothetical protein